MLLFLFIFSRPYINIILAAPTSLLSAHFTNAPLAPGPCRFDWEEDKDKRRSQSGYQLSAPPPSSQLRVHCPGAAVQGLNQYCIWYHNTDNTIMSDTQDCYSLFAVQTEAEFKWNCFMLNKSNLWVLSVQREFCPVELQIKLLLMWH